MGTCGIHLVWTCYGTWLPGDDRGHWSPLFNVYGRIIDAGGKLQMPDETSRRVARVLLREPPFQLDEFDATIVAAELSNLVGNGSAGDLRPVALAAAIEPTHIHLLVGPVTEDLHRFGGRIKGRTSSEVLKSGRHGTRSHIWTEKFWKVFLYDAIGVAAVREYIEAHNVRAGRQPNPFTWCHPEWT